MPIKLTTYHWETDHLDKFIYRQIYRQAAMVGKILKYCFRVRKYCFAGWMVSVLGDVWCIHCFTKTSLLYVE